MTRTGTTAAALAALALLCACSGSGGSSASATSSSSPSSRSPSAASSASGSGSQPAESASASSGSASPVPTTLQALQLCVTTLGYAAGAIAGQPSDEMDTFKKAIESARSKATAIEAGLSDQAAVVLAAVKSGDAAAITASAETMSKLCGGA